MKSPPRIEAMKLALISDIHANLPALEAVLDDIATRRPDALYCLGDLVGYAPWPNEAIDLVRGHRIPTIAGNYDVGVGLNSDDCGCAYKTDEERNLGAQSIAWTNGAISEANRRYLRGLPRHIRIEFGSETRNGVATLMLVHGSPRRVNEYLFEDRRDSSFQRMMQEASCTIMAFGHTHRPFHRIVPSPDAGEAERYLHAVNIGSVGKPKDEDPRACYAVLTIERPDDLSRADSIGVEFVRVEYDIERSASAILESPLPDEFAHMLLNGGPAAA